MAALASSGAVLALALTVTGAVLGLAALLTVVLCRTGARPTPPAEEVGEEDEP